MRRALIVARRVYTMLSYVLFTSFPRKITHSILALFSVGENRIIRCERRMKRCLNAINEEFLWRSQLEKKQLNYSPVANEFMIGNSGIATKSIWSRYTLSFYVTSKLKCELMEFSGLNNFDNGQSRVLSRHVLQSE